VYFERALLLAADCENYCPVFVRHFLLTGLLVFLLSQILWSLTKHVYQPRVDDLLSEFLLVFYANCSTVMPDSLS
jgi:hypothetical protein